MDDVEALRQRFPQTRDLYREVCALLFFRYGITPTANKLYQLVRKGSMSVPTDAVKKFWEDLREKSRTRVEHPDLPDALKDDAGELVAKLWTDAQTLAHDSLATYRLETEQTVREAIATAEVALSERNANQLALQKANQEIELTSGQINVQLEELAAAKEAASSLQARLEEVKQDNAELQRQLEKARYDFAVELDKLRAAAQLAEERTRSTEKHMLLEVERERTASAKLKKEREALNSRAMQAADQHQRAIGMLQQTLGDIRQQNGQLDGALQITTKNLETAILDSQQKQTQLNEARAQTVLLQREALDWKRQFEESQELLKKTQATKLATRKRRRSEQDQLSK